MGDDFIGCRYFDTPSFIKLFRSAEAAPPPALRYSATLPLIFLEVREICRIFVRIFSALEICMILYLSEYKQFTPPFEGGEALNIIL